MSSGFDLTEGSVLRIIEKADQRFSDLVTTQTVNAVTGDLYLKTLVPGERISGVAYVDCLAGTTDLVQTLITFIAYNDSGTLLIGQQAATQINAGPNGAEIQAAVNIVLYDHGGGILAFDVTGADTYTLNWRGFIGAQ